MDQIAPSSERREAVTDEEFAEAWAAGGGSPVRVARLLGISERNVYARRNRLRAIGVDLPTESLNPGYARRKWTYPRELALLLPQGGTVLVGGDAHAWPGEIPPIWRAFCTVAKELKPDVIVLNGDLIDGARVSSHPRLRNQNAPRVSDECDAFRSWLELLPSAPEQIWTIGNHDMRVDRYLANLAPEMDDWAGSLSDRFPEWRFGYAATINDTVEIRHRFRGGIHAAYNNAMHSGISVVSNHTHQLNCTPIVDRRGTRWGVETGCLNDVHAPVFEYSEGMASRQRAGFAVLTFDSEGRLMPPELCQWVEGKPIFRNEVVNWRPRYRVPARVG